jgi:hypothetical protein
MTSIMVNPLRIGVFCFPPAISYEYKT